MAVPVTVDGAVWSVVGLIIGWMGAQVTIGNKVSGLVIEVRELTRRVGVMEGAPHYHRRSTDDE